MRSAVVTVVALAACGPSRGANEAGDSDRWDCRERLVSYVASHHLGASELGVQLDCLEGPRIKRWKVDEQGSRIEDARWLSPGEFDKLWREIDGTGWPNLQDCANGTAGKQDPVYVFDVKDDTNKATFQCQSRSMPYPYNGIVDPLDVAAQQGRGQLGDPEPAELKALEKKSRQ